MVNQYIGMMDHTAITHNVCFALGDFPVKAFLRILCKRRECDCDSDCKKYSRSAVQIMALFVKQVSIPLPVSASQYSQICAPTLAPQIMSNTWSISGLDFTNMVSSLFHRDELKERTLLPITPSSADRFQEAYKRNRNRGRLSMLFSFLGVVHAG